jgi:hypothetical protein
MRREVANTEQDANVQNIAGAETAYAYLKSLPRNLDRSALDSYKRGRESAIIDSEVAETFTTDFRGATVPFDIPMSWTLTKDALVNLLGITYHEGHAAVNGVRFYAGLNTDNQLTLIAVSTKAGSGCNDDLTLDDEYPYYDFADPCPNNCSGSGNLRILSGLPAPLKVAAVSV